MNKDKELDNNNNLRNLFGKLKDYKIDSQKFKDEIRREEKLDFERLARETLN